MNPYGRSRKTLEALNAIGKVTLEKLESLTSKISDDVATTDDRIHHGILREIVSLAMNRVSVTENETSFEQGLSTWTERTSESHYPHIRLHGGALEDDPLKMRI